MITTFIAFIAYESYICSDGLIATKTMSDTELDLNRGDRSPEPSPQPDS